MFTFTLTLHLTPKPSLVRPNRHGIAQKAV